MMKPLILSVLALMLTQAPHALAGDKPLIWQPTKNSDTSYTARIGVRMPTVLAPAAGVEMGVVASEGGAVVDAPVAAWGDLRLREYRTPASTGSRNAGARFNARTGSASLTMNYYEKYIATPSLDIERSSSYAVRYNGPAAEWKGVETSQSIRFSRVRSGSAAFVNASAADTFSNMTFGVGFEQKLGRNLTVKATVRERLGADDRSTLLRADYSFRW